MLIERLGNGTQVTRPSLFTRKTNTMLFAMPYEHFLVCYERWLGGMYIQNAFPDCTADQREFLMTGATPAEWDAMFKG